MRLRSQIGIGAALFQSNDLSLGGACERRGRIFSYRIAISNEAAKISSGELHGDVQPTTTRRPELTPHADTACEVLSLSTVYQIKAGDVGSNGFST